MIGIGGVGMSGVARMLLSEGLDVTGSDMKASGVLETLLEMGCKVEIGHSAGNIPEGTEMVVISAAVKEDNPELAEARRRGLEVVKYAQALGLLMESRRGVAVSGTHGKTTTTAMLAWILEEAGLEASFVVGAEVPALGTSSREGGSDIFVAEACEYDRSFLNLRPKVIVITNIEEDHLDYYRDIGEIVEAFKEFVGLLPEDGFLVANAHDRNVRSVAAKSGRRCETFGVRTQGDWRAEGLEGRHGSFTFDVVHGGRLVGEVSLTVPGVYNVLNALAAMAVCEELGVEFAVAAEALGSFGGAARRFEVVGGGRGVRVVDDYAHHPTEIQVTLKAARDYAGAGRLWVVFQPHQYSRTRFFLKDFARSFSQADRIIVPDIYFVRDSDQERKAVNAQDLVRELEGLGHEAEYIAEWDDIVDRIAGEVEAGDVVITMGAGNVNEVAYALVKRLQPDS